MFERNKNKPAATAPSPPASPAISTPPTTPNPVPARNDAMIGASIKIKGTISGDEDLLIQGMVEGTISLKAHEVSIGESGKVTADIQAKTVKIDGEVAGDITCAEKVVISRSGNVKGNIVAPRVTLEDGAIFKGSIDMDPGEPASGKVSLAPEKPAASNRPGKPSPQLDLKSG